jgi:putative cell wall-binding protein
VADRVLLIGNRAAVLTSLQAALREIGIQADLTQDTAGADRGELREYSAVAFGRTAASATSLSPKVESGWSFAQRLSV